MLEFHLNPFDPQLAGMEAAYMADLEHDARLNRLQQADRELDRLIEVLKNKEDKEFDDAN